MNGCWKQPIPVDILDEFGEDYLCTNLFIHLLLRAANDKQIVKPGKKLVTLERGESIFGRNSFGKYLLVSPSTVERALGRIEKVYEKVTCKRTSNFTIVSIVDYDKLVRMDRYDEQVNEQQVSKKRTGSEQVVNTHKSVRVKERKSVKNIYTLKWIEEHREEVISKLETLYPDKDANVAYDDFVQKNRAKKYGYTNFLQALENWVREDNFNRYKKGSYITKTGVSAPNKKYDY